MVGYQTKSLDVDAGEYLHSVGVNFSCMESETGTYTVSDKLFDTTAAVDDQVLVFDPDVYDLTTYQYLGAGSGWFVSAADGSTATIASFEIAPGNHFLFLPSDGSKDLTLSGEVAASGTQTVTFTVTEEEYLFELANPYPVDTTISDLNSFCQVDDQVLVFDPDVYDLTTYQYLGAGSGWFVSAADGSTYTISTTSDVIIPAGQGGWLIPAEGSRTWTVSCNY